jgi:Rrf2 family protein
VVGIVVTFSAKTQYALVALIELAAIHGQGGVLQVGEIAQRKAIPDRYLEQMLTTLRRSHILRSLRGPKGGYQLARPPGQVKLAEIVKCEFTAQQSLSNPQYFNSKSRRGPKRITTLAAAEQLALLIDNRDLFRGQARHGAGN